MGRNTQAKGGSGNRAKEDEADATQRDLSRGGLKPSHDELGHELSPEGAHAEERKRNDKTKSSSIGGPDNQSGKG